MTLGNLSVLGSDTLLTAATAALLRELGCSVQVEDGPDLSGVRVVDPGSDRWMFISPLGGPDPSAVSALSNGAIATLNVASRRAEVELAIRALLDGKGGYVPIDMMRWIAGEAMGKTASAPRPALTAREREILRLVAHGCSNNEIAELLTITTNTVRTHLRTLSVKLGATSRTRMLANARALAIPEAFDSPAKAAGRTARVPA